MVWEMCRSSSVHGYILPTFVLISPENRPLFLSSDSPKFQVLNFGVNFHTCPSFSHSLGPHLPSTSCHAPPQRSGCQSHRALPPSSTGQYHLGSDPKLGPQNPISKFPFFFFNFIIYLFIYFGYLWHAKDQPWATAVTTLKSSYMLGHQGTPGSCSFQSIHSGSFDWWIYFICI